MIYPSAGPERSRDLKVCMEMSTYFIMYITSHFFFSFTMNWKPENFPTFIERDFIKRRLMLGLGKDPYRNFVDAVSFRAVMKRGGGW